MSSYSQNDPDPLESRHRRRLRRLRGPANNKGLHGHLPPPGRPTLRPAAAPPAAGPAAAAAAQTPDPGCAHHEPDDYYRASNSEVPMVIDNNKQHSEIPPFDPPSTYPDITSKKTLVNTIKAKVKHQGLKSSQTLNIRISNFASKPTPPDDSNIKRLKNILEKLEI